MEGKSWLHQLMHAVIRPGDLFNEWPEKASFWPPALFFVAVNVLLAVVLLPKTKEAAIYVLESAAAADPAQIEIGKEMINIMLPFITITGALVMPFIVWMVQAALIAVVGRFFGIEASFRKLMPVAVVAWTPSLLGGLVQSVLVLSSPVEALSQVKVSLAALLPLSENPGILYLFLDKLNPFTIWNLVLLGMGAAAVARCARERALVLVFSLWMIYVVISMLPGIAGLGLNSPVL